MLAGTIEIFPNDENLTKVETVINNFIKSVESHVLDSLDMELADSLTETLKTIIDMMVLKKTKGLDVSLWTQHNKSIFYFLIRILGVYNNFRLLGKQEPDHIMDQKKKVTHIFN
jgi:hypothetical protein